MKIIHFLTRLLFIWRYPGYLSYLYQRYFIPLLVQTKGVEISNNVSFIGMPIVSMTNETNIQINSNCLLCSSSKHTALGVNHPVILRTLRKGSKIIIGKGVRMSGTTICAMQCVIIGDNSCFGANAMIVDNDFHAIDPAIRDSRLDQDCANVEKVEIGQNVFVGAGSFILKGVSIGEGSVIGAGSVVTKSIPAFSIAAGNPAKIIGIVPGNNYHLHT